ncbi:putative Pectin lyase-like superfamily protein [Quillaja saponaria]|uniref:Pectin lyase-like superfamily protein n=1 Tax=Quillaja saponaria TaxID=32244 RepID=A0AAD7PP51_QUISA|nr:putative Pectin lyase-like superfamily protein [Quillaja saponaria]
MQRLYMGFIIKGVLKAPTDPSLVYISDKWISFQRLENLVVSGGGTLDGQGTVAWSLNDCSKNPNCRTLPTTMRFDFVKNVQIHHLRSIDSKSNHFMIFGCENMNITELRILAPGDSPNTDGIKIGRSFNVDISRIIIGTGDDCIALISGTKNVHISQVDCGPGHGISVGSLGKYQEEEDVEDIVVKNCSFHGTSDGVRIKTWASRFDVKASNLVYEDIVMNNVGNPIIIDQQYCPHPPCNQETASNVQISGVTYKNIRGSSRSDVAVSIRCSQSRPCKNITMEGINLKHQIVGGLVRSQCSHVNGVSYGKQNPPSCI